MRIDPRDNTIQDDIMEIIDLSELHIIEDACERSSYKARSESARLAINRTEAGTIDRRTVNFDGEHLRYESNNRNTAFSAPSIIKKPTTFVTSKYSLPDWVIKLGQ